MCSGKENPDSDADLDVDGDDTLEYGKPQYPWGTVGQGGAGGTGQKGIEKVASASGTCSYHPFPVGVSVKALTGIQPLRPTAN